MTKSVLWSFNGFSRRQDGTNRIRTTAARRALTGHGDRYCNTTLWAVVWVRIVRQVVRSLHRNPWLSLRFGRCLHNRRTSPSCPGSQVKSSPMAAPKFWVSFHVLPFRMDFSAILSTMPGAISFNHKPILALAVMTSSRFRFAMASAICCAHCSALITLDSSR